MAGWAITGSHALRAQEHGPVMGGAGGRMASLRARRPGAGMLGGGMLGGGVVGAAWRLLLAVLLLGAPASAQAPGPDSIVRLLYQHYIDTPAGLVFAFDYTDPVVASNYFEPMLARMLVADARDDEPRLDFDPFVGGQDFEIRSVDLETRMLSDDKAEVVARFKNFDEDEIRVFTVERTKRGWRIYDVRGEDDAQSLRDFLAEGR